MTTAPAGQPWNTPPPPSTPPYLHGVDVDLRVSKRLLWVDRAAYSLQNIARVYTLTVHPRRKEAVVRFGKNAAITVAVTLALTILGALTSIGSSSDNSGAIAFTWAGALAALVYFLWEMLSVLAAQPRHVLAVETSGPSTAVLSSPNREQPQP